MRLAQFGLTTALIFAGSSSFAVEGGLGAYLLGSRTTFAGIVPGPGSYLGIDIVTSSGSVKGRLWAVCQSG